MMRNFLVTVALFLGHAGFAYGDEKQPLILLVAPPDDLTMARIRAELDSAKFTTLADPIGDRFTRGWFESRAAETGAQGALHIIPPKGDIEIWSIDFKTKRAVLVEVVSGPTLEDRSSDTQALRAVELLRASIAENDSTATAFIGPPPTRSVENPGSSAQITTPQETGAPVTPEPKTPRFWGGLAASFDFTWLDSADRVCKLDPMNGFPLLDGYYCTDYGGSDYPSRATSLQTALVAPDASVHGFAEGRLRLMFSFDTLVSRHLMVGGRLGYAFGGYPGLAAHQDGKEWSTSLHLEARATYLFGKDPLGEKTFAPLIMAGAGASPWDVKASTTIYGPVGANDTTPTTLQRDVWKIGGPLFVGAGVGVRYALSRTWGIAVIPLHANFAFGSGSLLVFSPEIGIQQGF